MTRNIEVLSSYELNNTTTYSGTDIRAFVYRDLSSLLTKSKEGKSSNSTDGTTRREEATKTTITNKSPEPLSTAGTVQKGQKKNGSNRYQSSAPTNINDYKYATTNRSLSEHNNTVNKNGISVTSAVKELGTLKAISYSSFREKMAVRTLGRVHPKDYTRGQRTVAGTMVFSILQSHELLNFANSERIANSLPEYAMLDQIDPFNMILIFENEYGAMSSMHIFNIDISTEGQNMSVNDLETTNSMNFYATDVLPIMSNGNHYKTTSDMLWGAINNDAFINRSGSTSISNMGRLDNTQGEEAVQNMLKRSRGLF